MTTYKELADRLGMFKAAEFQEAAAILRSLDAQRSESEPLHVASIYHLAQTSGISTQRWHNKGDAAVFSTGLNGVAKDDFINVMRRAYELGRADAAPVAAQPPSQPVDPVHVINTAIDAMMRRDATIAGVLFDFMGWLTTRKERLCLSSADDASPAVTAITEFAKMRNLSLDNAMVTDWQFGAAQASKPLSDEPNMFWNHDDPESPYGGIGEFLNDEWAQTGLAVGDIRRVQRAIRLPDVMVRVTAVSDDGDIDYIVEPVGGIKEST